MESSIHRFFNNCCKRIKFDNYRNFKIFFAILYVLSCVAYIVYCATYYLRVIEFNGIVHVVIIYLIFMIINHMYIKYIIPHKVLLYIEMALLFIVSTIFYAQVQLDKYYKNLYEEINVYHNPIDNLDKLPPLKIPQNS